MGEVHNRQTDLRRLRAAYDAFVALCARMSPEVAERAGACGTWSVRAVVAHLAGWDGEAARRFAELTADPTSQMHYAVDETNARWVSERAALDWHATLADLAATFPRLVAAAQAVPDAAYESSNGFQEWMVGCAADYTTHTQEIEQWLRGEQVAHG